MRLIKHDERVATKELLEKLRILFPEGATTNELFGTPGFYGRRTLTGRQIARLLRASGAVDHQYKGSGYWRASRWTLRSFTTSTGRLNATSDC